MSALKEVFLKPYKTGKIVADVVIDDAKPAKPVKQFDQLEAMRKSFADFAVTRWYKNLYGPES